MDVNNYYRVHIHYSPSHLRGFEQCERGRAQSGRTKRWTEQILVTVLSSFALSSFLTCAHLLSQNYFDKIIFDGKLDYTQAGESLT